MYTNKPSQFFLSTLNPGFAREKPVAGEEEYTAGNQFYLTCQFKKSLPHFEEASSKGYPAGYLRLGYIYNGCMDVCENKAKVDFYYQKVAENIQWFIEQAEKTGDGKFNLALCYEQGLGVKQDAKNAFLLYKDAAKLSHAAGQSSVAFCYANGQGVEKNEKKAVEYYKKAANQGHANACYNLGLCYEQGIGIEKDETKAHEYYEQALNQGNKEASAQLGLEYKNSESESKSSGNEAKRNTTSSSITKLYGTALNKFGSLKKSKSEGEDLNKTSKRATFFTHSPPLKTLKEEKTSNQTIRKEKK